MDYKEKLEKVKEILGISKKEETEVELAEQPKVEEQKQEAAPEQPKVDMSQELASIKNDMEMFKSEIAEMFSAFVENVNKTEKNKVPVAASKVEEKVKVEEVKEDVELATVVKHDPTSVEKKTPVFDFSKRDGKQTTEERVFARLNNVFEMKN